MSDSETKAEYEALPLPAEALARGGVELLRAAVNEDELFILARPALKDPAEWGEILAEITRRLGLLYEMDDTGFSEQDVIVAIEEAYAVEMGAKPVAKSAKREASPRASAPKAKRTAKKVAPRGSKPKTAKTAKVAKRKKR
jgi:Domain of unknown function (DUF5076)